MSEENETPRDKSYRRYEELFDTQAKADAFDKLAEMYYMCDFGSATKADVDLLMFSEYIDKVADKGEGIDDAEYTNYTLSKYLGITQNRINSLKEKKQLKYPYSGFDWKESFEKIVKKDGNIRYENGKVIFNIRDRNLYLEIKNAIEENGGFIENDISPTALKIPVEYFLDFMVMFDGGGEKEEKEIKKTLRTQLKDQVSVTEYIETDPIEKIFEGLGIDKMVDLLEIVPFDNLGKETVKILQIVTNKIKGSYKKGKKNK